MYKVSKQYLERIYSGGAKSKAKIKFNGVELEDANRLIEKITIKRRILANGSERFSLDNFIATEIEMIMHTSTNLWNLGNKFSWNSNADTWVFIDGKAGAYGSNIGTKTNYKYFCEKNKTYIFQLKTSNDFYAVRMTWSDETSDGVTLLSASRKTGTIVYKIIGKNDYIIPSISIYGMGDVEANITDVMISEDTEIPFYVPYLNLDTIKEPVDISIGTLVGDTYEYVPIGIFKIEGSPTTDKGKITLQLRDNAIKFDFNYNAQPVIDNNGGSATLKQIFNNICELAEVETDVTSFNGEDLKFGIFDNTITARQYISYIAEQAGMMATIDRTGKLTFVDLNSDSAQIVSGKTVTFDSELERSLSFQVNGSTEQSTYDGKNKFNYITTLVSSNYGLTNKINADGSITTTGKPTRDYASIVSGYNITDELEDGETYTLSQAIASDKVYAQINARKSDNTYTYIPLNNKTIKTRAFKVDKTTYASYTIDVQTTTMATWGDSSLTITNKYMLCKGTDNASTSFEPYVGGQPSPSPDYPSEIENVKGRNLLPNLLAQGSWNTTNTHTRVSNYSNVYLKAGTYTFSSNIDTTKYKVWLGTGTVKFPQLNWSYVNEIQTWSQFRKKTFTTTTDSYFLVMYRKVDDSNITPDELNGLEQQLEKGSIATRYVPYGNIQIVKTGKNLFNPAINFRESIGGLTNTLNPDGSITISGKPTYNFVQVIGARDITDELEDGKVYTLSQTNKQTKFFGSIAARKSDGTNTYFSSSPSGSVSITINKSIYTNYLIYMQSSSTAHWGDESLTITSAFQLEKGSTATDYEPYTKEVVNIDLKGNELCSNKDKSVKDNLFVTKNGKTEIFKKIDEYVFTGNETLKFADSNRRIYCSSEIVTKLKNVYIPTPQSSSNITPSFCTHYTVDGQGNVVKGSNKFGFSQWSTTKYIYFPADYDTVGEFKAFLKAQYNAGTPVKVQFQLENPETIELDTVTPLKSYIGQNNISNNADVDMNVTYDLKRQPFEIPIRIVESLEKDETYKIGRVEYEDALRKFEQGEQDDYLYINSANPYISNQKQISDIYELLNGYSIDTFKTGKIIGNPALDGYDLIKFVYKNKEYITLNQGTLTFNGVMIQTNETTIGTEAKQSNVTVKSQAAKFKRAFTEIDAVNAQVKITTEQTNTIQDNLTNNYYTIEQSNTLIQNAQSGLTNTFSEAGGNNIFRNTGLWFSQSDANNPYEYWTGKNVSRQNTDKSSNGSLMMLKKGTLEQEQVVSNGNYTVSFKYKKLIQLATCKVIVNDNEYELTQMTDTEWQTGSKDADGNIVIKPLEVTSNHINVKFTSTVDNAIEIYDLMVNAGTVKLAYSQNENEVTTDTVNISKGITITSSANDTKFKANADGIRIVDKNNEKTILTKFTDKGMSTKELEVENSATIVKVLVQNVGDQTWFTRI